MELNVNYEQLEIEISNLNTLLNESNTYTTGSFALNGKGSVHDWMQAVNNYYFDLQKALSFLIESTASLLENAKDGYIDVDQSMASFLQAIKDGVSK